MLPRIDQRKLSRSIESLRSVNGISQVSNSNKSLLERGDSRKEQLKPKRGGSSMQHSRRQGEHQPKETLINASSSIIVPPANKLQRPISNLRRNTSSAKRGTSLNRSTQDLRFFSVEPSTNIQRTQDTLNRNLKVSKSNRFMHKGVSSRENSCELSTDFGSAKELLKRDVSQEKKPALTRATEQQNSSVVNLARNSQIPKQKRNITRTSLDCLSFSKLNVSKTDNSVPAAQAQAKDAAANTQLDLTEYSYLAERERSYFKVLRAYPFSQHYTWFNRSNIVDNLFRISYDFRMKRETTHIAINFLDRYMAAAKVTTKLQEQQIQEIAATSLYIASKCEEIQPPAQEFFAKTPEMSMTDEQLVSLERDIIQTLDFNLTVPTLNNWLNVYVADFDCQLGKMQLNGLQFRATNENSFAMYSELFMQLDASVLIMELFSQELRMVALGLLKWQVINKHGLKNKSRTKEYSTDLFDKQMKEYRFDKSEMDVQGLENIVAIQDNQDQLNVKTDTKYKSKQTWQEIEKSKSKQEDIISFQLQNEASFKQICRLKKRNKIKLFPNE